LPLSALFACSARNGVVFLAPSSLRTPRKTNNPFQLILTQNIVFLLFYIFKSFRFCFLNYKRGFFSLRSWRALREKVLDFNPKSVCFCISLRSWRAWRDKGFALLGDLCVLRARRFWTLTLNLFVFAFLCDLGALGETKVLPCLAISACSAREGFGL
jgi:hypothetical protein